MVWLKLGYAALQTEDWKLAATAYRRYCALESYVRIIFLSLHVHIKNLIVSFDENLRLSRRGTIWRKPI